MAESDRRPGESERDWMKRLAELAAQAKRRSRDEQRQASADAAAEEAAIREAFGDEVWLAGATRDLFGLTPDQLDAQLTKAQQNSRDWTKFDEKVMKEYDQAKKRRFLESKSARNRRVAKHLKKNKNKIQKVAKKGKKGWFW